MVVDLKSCEGLHYVGQSVVDDEDEDDRWSLGRGEMLGEMAPTKRERRMGKKLERRRKREDGAEEGEVTLLGTIEEGGGGVGMPSGAE